MPVREALTPGRVSPMRQVPARIPRPEYVGKPAPTPSTDPWVQTPEVIEAMRVASRIAARALAAGGEAVAPGVTTDEVDRVVHEFLVEHDAYPSTLGYRGFPKSCCT
ncbi:MAG: M24 family metallopeptidase, partial [Pseudonocardia sp.]|nr:M24 family metallopeptidase [Pseudonocardia sp.]